MEFRNKKIILASGIVAVSVLFVSVAFAALASQLNISFGNVTQNSLSWNVGFKGSSVTPTQEGTSNTGLSCGTATITPSTVSIADSTLSKPDDKCTYPLTIENTGDISANLSSIAISQPTNMTCTKQDEATMVCGNITLKLTTKSGAKFSTGVTINPGEEYNLNLIVQYSGTTLNSNNITISNSKVTFSYVQSSKRMGSVKPDGVKEKEPICKRATILHTETCSINDDYGCNGKGYSEGSTITYGTFGTTGTLSAGDAFDCDVNGDGNYDPETERFYYISGLDGDDTSPYATLIFYTNVSGGEIDSLATFNYSFSSSNLQGPTAAYLQLPSTSQWPNVSLSNQTRQIYTIDGETSLLSNDLPQFTYENRAARLLTTAEINKACNITIGTETKGELDSCDYLLENTFYGAYAFGERAQQYWLETPDKENTFYAYVIYGNMRYAAGVYSGGGGIAVRPAIEVLKTDIDY